MAGHSKWANIKHRKAGQDARRGKLFTKLIRELASAAKVGGGDPESNPRLRSAVNKALSCNMTRDTINRSIQRGIGGGEDSNLESLLYEGYGPGGTAILVACLTDNRKRTVSEVRHAFDKCGGNLGNDGSVAYLFDRKGVIYLPGQVDEEALLTLVIEAGADDLQGDPQELSVVLTPSDRLIAVQQVLEQHHYPIQQAEISWIAQTLLTLDVLSTERLQNLLDRLDDLDDVQTVYHNAQLADELSGVD